MGVSEEVARVKPLCSVIAEVLMERGVTSSDFNEILARLILKEMEYIEQQHAD